MTERAGVFSRLKKGLEKTRQILARGFGLGNGVDLEEVEEALIQADVGVGMARDIVKRIARRSLSAEQAVREVQAVLLEALSGKERSLLLEKDGLNVVLMVGVNGVGKTTTMAKLAYLLGHEGYRPLLAASDTFRAAAAEQLEVWGQRLKVPVVRQAEGSDPAAVAFDAIRSAKARGQNLVLVDTAGRLHTKANLMEELKKIRRVVSREIDGAPQEVLLVLDATTGQNALRQSQIFAEAVGVTGIVLAKMDGTAKGGIALSVEREVGIPVKFVAVGEGISDLVPFEPAAYVEGLFK